MTRDFNKQRRDDMRPSSRNQNHSSNKQGAEYTPGPARPRLNRESVDRAWESGAPNQHADYRPRRNGPPPRDNNWRRNPHQQAGSPSAPYDRQYQPQPRPSSNPAENNRRFERTPNPNGYSGPRSRPFDSNRGNFEDQRPRFNDRDRSGRGYSDGPEGRGPNFRDNDNRPSYNQRPPTRDFRQGEGSGYNRDYNQRSQPRAFDQDRGRGSDQRPQPRGFGQDQERGSDQRSQPRNFAPRREDSQGQGYQRRDAENGYRPSRSGERDTRPPRRFEDENRPSRAPRDFQPRSSDIRNPRWESRPSTQRENSSYRPAEAPHQQPEGGRFAGDYEGFSAEEVSEQPLPRQPYQRYPDKPRPSTEGKGFQRPVTRLADGRVLKGPRPVQRKNAEFWTNIAQDTEALVEQVEVAPDEADASPVAPTEPGEIPATEADETKARRKPRTRGASNVGHGKKGKGATKTPSAGSIARPSRRGFKWPAP